MGGGTGFCTQGVVAAGIRPDNITLIDQSPHQLAKAKKKPDLQAVTILEVSWQGVPVRCGSVLMPDGQALMRRCKVAARHLLIDHPDASGCSSAQLPATEVEASMQLWNGRA